MSVLAVLLIVVGLVLLYAFVRARRHERELERERRRVIFDERIAQNGINPERRLEVKAAPRRVPPRPPRR